MSVLVNKLHYYKSKLNRGYTDLNVYNSKENDYIKVANFTEGNVSNGVFVQATRWQQKLNATVVKDVSGGFGMPSDIKLPSIKVGVADNASLNTDLLKVRFAPSFIATDGKNYKTICAGSYKLLDAVQETSPFTDKEVAVGTDTCKTYILLMLDNSYGIYNNAENFSNLVRPFLVGGMMNWVCEGKSVRGYRGVKDTAFPVHTGTMTDPTGQGTATTMDNIVSKWQFKFNLALDPVVPSLIHKEGTTKQGKPYKMSMITFGSFTGQSTTNFHEDKMTNGLNIKGCIGIYQLGETEDDRANFMECEILPSSKEFDTDESGNIISQTILETLAGQGLISTENLRQMTTADSDSSVDSPIYTLGLYLPLSYLYDMVLGQHNEGDIPVGAYCITKFEEQKAWSGVETHIKLDQTLSQAETEYTLPYPVVCYPKVSVNQAIIDACGATAETQLQPAKPNRLHFVEAKECLAFANDLAFLWDSAQTTDEAWSDDEKQAISDKIAEAEDYNTSLYSYSTIINAIKAVYLARTEGATSEEALSAEREAVYEAMFKRKWNNDSQTDNIEYDAYEIECYQPYYCDEPISLSGLTENSAIDSPSYLLWGALNDMQVPVTKHIHNEAEINGYYKPKGYVANVANVIIGAKALTDTEVKADLEYARVWKDIEGKDPMKSGLVEDLYSLKELYDQMNKQGVPILDTSKSEFFKNLCYGRVKDKMPMGSWWFMNCHKDAWAVEDSIIDSVWWEKGENFDLYLVAEEGDNPDLNCKTVSFRTKDGCIDTDYFKDKNYAKIYCSIYYCARAKNGKETKQEFRFEIVEPIVLGMFERLREYTGITNNVWSAGTYKGVGQFWRKKWINRPLSELDKLGVQSKESSRMFHINNCAMCVTPRYITYRHDTSKRYEVPMLAIPAQVLEYERALDLDKRKYRTIEVKATDGSTHLIPVTPMLTDTKATKLTAGAYPECDTKYGGGGGGGLYFDNYSLIYGYKGGGLEKCEELAKHLVDFGKGVYIRDRVMCSAYQASSSSYYYSSSTSSSSLCPVYICGDPVMALQPESFQYRGGSWGAGGRNTNLKAETSTEWFNEFCDTRYGANGYPKADKWLRTEQIYIPASDKNDNSAYLVYRWMWEDENFKEADLYDNSKWKEMYAEVKKGYLIFARGSRPIHLIADWNTWITDLSAIKIYQIDGLIKERKLPKGATADTGAERVAKTAKYAEAIYSALQDLDNSIAKGFIEPKYDITRDECRYGEFCMFDEDGKAIGHNTMFPADSQGGYYDWNYGTGDMQWLRYSDDNAFSPHSQINIAYSGQVDGFQELEWEALVLDKDNLDYYLPKSMYKKWIDHENGLPFSSDYHRQVMMRKVKTDDPAETRKCWAIYDSINYELKVSGGDNNPPKLVRHDGREWNTRNDFMYDNFTFYPRFHYVRFEFETRDVSKNLQHRYRFYAVSMGEFELDPAQLLKQLRGEDTTEQIVCVKGWTLDTKGFFNPTGMTNLLEADKGETHRYLGSCRITNADMTQDFVSDEATDDNLGYYVVSVNYAKGMRIFSVPHRAFFGLYAPEGGFDFDYKTQKFTPKIFQDSDGSLKLENYTGYWFSANPVSVRRRTEATEYDTKDNYDNTFCDWFFQAGAYYHNSTTPTFQTKRTISIDGVSSSQDLMNRNDLEWCVTGGAPSQYQTGRIIGSVCYGNDLSWDGKLGYIPARFIGKNKELIKTQLGMMSIENHALTDARWLWWEIEWGGKSSTFSASIMLPTSNEYLTGANGNWLPAVTLSGGGKLAHNVIYQTICATSFGCGYIPKGSSFSPCLNGVGSIEYVIARTIQSGRVLGTTKNPARPLIDYRYFNHTRDSGSIACGLTAPNNANNKSYGNQVYGDGYIAYMSQWRGGSWNVGDSSLTRITGTEKSTYDQVDALGNTSVCMIYAPYGYDLPLGLSWNKNAGDTSMSYGYNHKNNLRMRTLLANKVVWDRYSVVLNEGVGNPAFASSVNRVEYTDNNYGKFVREFNFNTAIAVSKNWTDLKVVSRNMGSIDGIMSGLHQYTYGTCGGVVVQDYHYSKSQLFLNFPSVSSPFNFSLEHKQIADFSHQPTMLEKKKLRT